MSAKEEIIDWSKCLELSHGKKEVALELLAMLINDLPEYKQNIRKNYNAGDNEELYTQVHNLKGCVCYVSVPTLKDLVYRLEGALKQNDRNQIGEFVDQVELQIDKILDLYKNEFQ